MSDFEYSNTGPEPLRLPLILWQFKYRLTSSWGAGKVYYARAGSEEAAREFCRFYGHEYDGGCWEEIEERL